METSLVNTQRLSAPYVLKIFFYLTRVWISSKDLIRKLMGIKYRGVWVLLITLKY
jgi:hypothetical protein